MFTMKSHDIDFEDLLEKRLPTFKRMSITIQYDRPKIIPKKIFDKRNAQMKKAQRDRTSDHDRWWHV